MVNVCVAFGHPSGTILLRCGKFAVNVAHAMNLSFIQAEVITSARLAAGMTSRARRPLEMTHSG